MARVGFGLFYAVGVVLLLIFVTMPRNRYEWMLHPELGTEDAQSLPEDPDGAMRLAIVGVPLAVAGVVSLIVGIRTRSPRWRGTAFGYCIAVILAFIVKLSQ